MAQAQELVDQPTSVSPFGIRIAWYIACGAAAEGQALPDLVDRLKPP